MSSRALRKLQRQREEQQRVDEIDSDEDESPVENRRPVFNAFDLLNTEGDDDEEEDEEAEETEEVGLSDVKTPPKKPLHEETEDTSRQEEFRKEDVKQHTREESKATSTASGKKKKGKKNQKKKRDDGSKASTPGLRHSSTTSVDDIDRALQQLSTNDGPSPSTQTQSKDPATADNQDDSPTLCALLSIDSRALNAINEMKKLFGNIVLQPPTPTPRRNPRATPPVALDLGTALTGRFSPASGGKDFSGAAARKNALVQSKDEWPRAPSGGLGMEVVRRGGGGVVWYRLVWNGAYRDVQHQFEVAAESMQPEALIQHLQFNPYHLSTLLQVSEIAKHQGDHAVSADLLERALFNVGRSVHSSFSNLLRSGQARLSFDVKENREVWLAAWRYILNLGMKGTWRTAYEWAKLLLVLQPDDPYCISLILDSLAIRGRQQKHFIELCTHPFYKDRWAALPNIQCTLALAYLILGDEEQATRQLKKAIARYPWIFCRIAQEYNIEPIPKSIWGAQPPNDEQHLFTELYLERSKDLWNRPEALDLIKKVANSIETTHVDLTTPEITLDIARHVVLSDCKPAMTYVPRHFLSGRMSASDPLPPGRDPSQDAEQDRRGVLERLLQAQPNLLERLQQQLRPGDEQDRHLDFFDAGESEPDALQEPILQENLNAEGGSAAFQATDWLYGAGLSNLRAFLGEHGIDPGNWDEAVDVEPVTEWVEALRMTDPVNWQTVIETVADLLGSPLVGDLLREELEMQEGS